MRLKSCGGVFVPCGFCVRAAPRQGLLFLAVFLEVFMRWVIYLCVGAVVSSVAGFGCKASGASAVVEASAKSLEGSKPSHVSQTHLEQLPWLSDAHQVNIPDARLGIGEEFAEHPEYYIVSYQRGEGYYQATLCERDSQTTLALFEGAKYPHSCTDGQFVAVVPVERYVGKPARALYFDRDRLYMLVDHGHGFSIESLGVDGTLHWTHALTAEDHAYAHLHEELGVIELRAARSAARKFIDVRTGKTIFEQSPPTSVQNVLADVKGAVLRASYVHQGTSEALWRAQLEELGWPIDWSERGGEWKTYVPTKAITSQYVDVMDDTLIVYTVNIRGGGAPERLGESLTPENVGPTKITAWRAGANEPELIGQW